MRGESVGELCRNEFVGGHDGVCHRRNRESGADWNQVNMGLKIVIEENERGCEKSSGGPSISCYRVVRWR